MRPAEKLGRSASLQLPGEDFWNRSRTSQTGDYHGRSAEIASIDLCIERSAFTVIVISMDRSRRLNCRVPSGTDQLVSVLCRCSSVVSTMNWTKAVSWKLSENSASNESNGTIVTTKALLTASSGENPVSDHCSMSAPETDTAASIQR